MDNDTTDTLHWIMTLVERSKHQDYLAKLLVLIGGED
jgi:hypothetical protein